MIAIVNVSEEWGIGKENRLLVRIRSDMRRFRTLTSGNTIIVGRKTLATFPNGLPLPGRENIVFSRDPDYAMEGAMACRDLSQLRALLADRRPDSVFVCGGEQIYRLLLPFCSSALVTMTETDVDSDRFFPNLNQLPNWILSDAGERQTENDVSFRYLTYTNTDLKSL